MTRFGSSPFTAGTTREFSLYRWDDKAQGQDQVRKEHDHAMDEIRYFASTIAGKSGQYGWFAGSVERKAF